MANITGFAAAQYAQVVPAVAADTSFEVGVPSDQLSVVPRGKKAFTELTDADVIMYHAVSLDDPSKWEMGKVAYDGTNKQLDRLDASVIASSNAGNTVDFTRADGSKAGGVLVTGIAFSNVLNAYTVTSHTVDRAYDADSAVITETNDVLGTLIKDLIDAGILTGTVSA